MLFYCISCIYSDMHTIVYRKRVLWDILEIFSPVYYLHIAKFVALEFLKHH